MSKKSFDLFINLHVLNKILGQLTDIDWNVTPRLLYIAKYPLFRNIQLLSKAIDNYICAVYYEMGFPRDKFAFVSTLDDFVHHHHRKIMEVNFEIAEFLYREEYILADIYKNNINDLIALDKTDSLGRKENVKKFNDVRNIKKRKYIKLIKNLRYLDSEYKKEQLNWYIYSINLSHYNSYNSTQNVVDFMNQEIITILSEVNGNIIQYVLNSILLLEKMYPSSLESINMDLSFFEDFIDGKILNLIDVLPYYSLDNYYKKLNVFSKKDGIASYVMKFTNISIAVGRKHGYRQSYISNSFHTLVLYIKRFSYYYQTKKYDCLLTDTRKIFELFSSIYYFLDSDEETCELYARYLDARKYEEFNKLYVPKGYQHVRYHDIKIQFLDDEYTADEYYKFNMGRIQEILGIHHKKTRDYMWLYKHLGKKHITVKEYIVAPLKKLLGDRVDMITNIEYMYTETSIYQHPSLYDVASIYNDVDDHIKNYYSVVDYLCDRIIKFLYKTYENSDEIHKLLVEFDNIVLKEQ